MLSIIWLDAWNRLRPIQILFELLNEYNRRGLGQRKDYYYYYFYYYYYYFKLLNLFRQQ